MRGCACHGRHGGQFAGWLTSDLPNQCAPPNAQPEWSLWNKWSFQDPVRKEAILRLRKKSTKTGLQVR